MEALPPPPPVLYITTITEASIEAARLEFLRRAHETAASDDGIDFEDVVVTEHLSREQFDQVPRDWLRGVQVFLRGDGTLVVTNVENYQYEGATFDLSCQVHNYVTPGSGLYSRTARPLTLCDGSALAPAVEIHTWPTNRFSDEVPLALFEVEVYHRPIQRVIRTAEYYLQQLATVQRVVFVKFFPPHQPDLDEHREIRLPALAVVFCRSQNGRIRVEQMRSFGNAPVPAAALQVFVEPEADLALEPFADAVLHGNPSHELPEHVDAEKPYGVLMELRKDNGNRELFDVDMSAPRPPLRLDLVRLFA